MIWCKHEMGRKKCNKRETEDKDVESSRGSGNQKSRKIRQKETVEEESQTEAAASHLRPPGGTNCSSGAEECYTARSLCLTFFNNHTTVIFNHQIHS